MDKIKFENDSLDITEKSVDLRTKILDLVEQYSNESHRVKQFIPGKSMVPVSGRVYDDLEIKTLVASSLDFWLTTGRFNSEFEKQLKEFLGISFLSTVNSGSSANLLAISSLTSKTLGEKSLQPNDEVITVAAGFPTTVNPIFQNNLIPVFVDVEIPTYNVDINNLEDAISEKTKAIMLAHTLGNPFNIDAVVKLAKKYDLWVIEDCCDALGSKYDNKFVGTFGDVSTLSFYPAHHITMGEGGAIFTNNGTLKKIIDSFRDWGRDCFCAPGKNNTCGKRFEWQLGDLPKGYDHKYIYSHLGYNLKITDMQAAVGLAQLQKIDEFIKKRKQNFLFLKDELKILEEYLILPEATPKSEPSWFGFPITVKNSAPFSKNDLIIYLSLKGIDTRPIFAGNLTKQPYLQNKKFRISGDLSNTDKIMENSFWIGVFPGLTDAMLDYIVLNFKNFVNEIHS
jgi:CDP-4-dehydro-6-deoxyglucose reductase, E1